MPSNDPPPHDPDGTELNDRLRMELRRGSLTLAALAALRREVYAYSLRKKLQAVGVDIEEGTLYPLVRRLEGQGLLQSQWREGEGRVRRYYQISALGEVVLQALVGEWQTITESLKHLLEETP